MLVAWLHPACDMGAMRPGLYPRYPAWVANGRPVIVACGTTAYAARAATIAVTAVSRAGARVCVPRGAAGPVMAFAFPDTGGNPGQSLART